MLIKKASKREKVLIINSVLMTDTASTKKASDNLLSEAFLWSAHQPLLDQDQHDLFMPGFIAIPPTALFSGCDAYISSQSVDIQFSSPFQMLSSSVLNGGYSLSNRYVNLRVGSECIVGNTTPKQVFRHYLTDCALLHTVSSSEETLVGMMTAASMKSCRLISHTITDSDNKQASIFVMVTSGIGNLRAAGDEADYRYLYSAVHDEVLDNQNDESVSNNAMPSEIGTINIFVACNKILSPAAQAEALMLITEAKVLALSSLQLTSPLSGQLATGTGTDAVAIACPQRSDYLTHTVDDKAIDFMGKHTLLGEYLGRMVTAAVQDSVRQYALHQVSTA
jgi:iron complex transport system ATP-binding protein